ncbi:uncharacterized protein LOC135119946 [Zophobas morio]|uniref:uncharacterized protein LOC135119946 n=1 Tax=Zophobas morio TaxID=2755281 RepID=UPI0030835365
MNVRRVTFSEEGVSWTGKPLDYYIHVIDRSKLEYFFLNRTSARTSVLLKENGSSPRSLSTNRKRRKGDSKREDASSVENNLSDATRVSENHVKPQHSLAADSDSLLSLNESPSTALLLSSSSSCDEQINTPLECHITNPNDSLRIGVAGSSTSSSFSISATSPFSLLESPVLQAGNKVFSVDQYLAAQKKKLTNYMHSPTTDPYVTDKKPKMAPSQHYVHEIERNLLAIKSNISSLLLQQICEPLHVGTSLHSTAPSVIPELFMSVDLHALLLEKSNLQKEIQPDSYNSDLKTNLVADSQIAKEILSSCENNVKAYEDSELTDLIKNNFYR